MLHSQFVPHIVATMLQNWLGLGHAAFVQKSWLDCGKSLLHTKPGSNHVFFAAMLHSLFVPHIVATVPQSWLGLGHAAFVRKSWLDCGKSLLHTKLGSQHVFFVAMLHSLFVPHIVATMLQNWLGLGHAAFVQKSWLDCGKSLLHTKLGSNHVFFAAMLHSQFVPHIVATVPQSWLGLGHAAFVRKSWLDCGKSLLHTKLGSQHVFFVAMLHSLFVPHIVATMLQNWLGLGHAAFVQKSWLDCGKSLLHTKLGSNHVFFAAMLHSLFVPHIVATVPQSWLGLGHAAFVRKSWLDCGKSLLHTKLGSQHVFFVAMLHSLFVPHIVATMLQNWLGLGHAAFVQKSWLDCGKSLLHTKLGSNHVFFAAMLHSLFVPHIVATMPQSWLGLGHAAFVRKSWVDCGKSLLHTKLGSNHVFFAAMLHSQFVPHIVATVLQNWLGPGHAAFVQKSWLDCGKRLWLTLSNGRMIWPLLRQRGPLPSQYLSSPSSLQVRCCFGMDGCVSLQWTLCLPSMRQRWYPPLFGVPETSRSVTGLSRWLTWRWTPTRFGRACGSDQRHTSAHPLGPTARSVSSQSLPGRTILNLRACRSGWRSPPHFGVYCVMSSQMIGV